MAGMGDAPPEIGPVISRGMQTPELREVISAPGIPEGVPLPSFQFFSPDEMQMLQTIPPQQAEEFATVIAKAIQRSLNRFSIYTQSKPFDNYDVQITTCPANTATRLDRFAKQGQIARRALMFVNPNAADVLWIGKSNVGIAQGIPVAATNGTYLAGIHERAEHWGIIATQTNVVTIWYS